MDSDPRSRLHTGVLAFGLVTFLAALLIFVIAFVTRQAGPAPASIAPAPAPSSSPSALPSGPGGDLDLLNLKLDPGSLEKAFAGGGMGSTAPALALVGLVGLLGYAAVVLRLAVWAARDATNRGHEGSFWALLVLAPHAAAVASFLSLLKPSSFLDLFGALLTVAVTGMLSWSGLVVYYFARRRGALVVCEHCGNKHLEYLLACSHCRHPTPQGLEDSSDASALLPQRRVGRQRL